MAFDFAPRCKDNPFGGRTVHLVGALHVQAGLAIGWNCIVQTHVKWTFEKNKSFLLLYYSFFERIPNPTPHLSFLREKVKNFNFFCAEEKIGESDLESSRKMSNITMKNFIFVQEFTLHGALLLVWCHLGFVWIVSHGLNFYPFDLTILQYFYVSITHLLTKGIRPETISFLF